MSVQVNLTFNSVDEAIVALGKMVIGGVPVATVAKASIEPKSPRKGRSDAGQQRGPHKLAEPNAGAGTTASSTSGTTATGATAGDPVAAGGSPVTSTAAAPAPKTAAPAVAPEVPAKASAPVAAVPTPEQVQAAVEKLFTTKGYEDTYTLLKTRFGVERGKDVKPEQRADFIAKVDRVIAGEAI